MVLWKKEEVNNFKGETVEVEIHWLGGRERDLMLDEYIRTKFSAKDKGDNEAEVDYRPYTLKAKVMEKYVKGVPVDELSDEDYDRLFQTYFKDKFRDIFGESDQKNLEKTSTLPSEANTSL